MHKINGGIKVGIAKVVEVGGGYEYSWGVTETSSFSETGGVAVTTTLQATATSHPTLWTSRVVRQMAVPVDRVYSLKGYVEYTQSDGILVALLAEPEVMDWDTYTVADSPKYSPDSTFSVEVDRDGNPIAAP